MRKNLLSLTLLIISFTCLGQTRELSDPVISDEVEVLFKNKLNDSLAFGSSRSWTGVKEESSHALTGIQNHYRLEHSKAALPSILIAGAPGGDDWILDVEAKLEGTGRLTADTFLIQYGTPTLLELESYDAVFIFTDAPIKSPEGFGDVLGQYIDGGGAVVDASFIPNLPITGGFSAYQLYSDAGLNIGANLGIGTILEPGDPIFEGVSTFDGGASSYHHTGGTIAADAVVVAEYTTGAPFVIKKENIGPANARRVFLNFYPPSSSARVDFWNTDTDAALIMVNALLWAARRIQLITQDMVVELDNEGNATITPQDIDDGSTAADGIADLSLDISSFNCSNLGENTVTLILTDTLGNEAKATATVTVVDNSLPTVITQDIPIDLNGESSISISPQDIINSLSDNCTSESDITTSLDTDTFTDAGQYTVTVTVEDASGNNTTAEATVIVEDSTLGTGEFEKAQVSLYPNPAISQITIEATGINIEKVSMYDLTGKVVKTSKKSQINVSELSSGVYLVSLTDNAGRKMTRKFIKD